MRAKGRLMTMQAMTGKTEGRHSTLDEVLAMETGAQATVHGLVHTLRDLGDVRFALLRMPQGVLQCVLGAGEDVRDGDAVEITARTMKLVPGMAPAGEIFVDGSGVGDVGSVVLRDRRHLAQDGMIVVVLSMSGEDGALVSGPDIITRGFVYVKESEGLMEELRQVAMEAIQGVDTRYATDWSAIKSAIKGDLSNYLYKKTKRSPMILPVIMEV